jgi:hypothetical protein
MLLELRRPPDVGSDHLLMALLCHVAANDRATAQAPRPTEDDLRRAAELIREGRADAR